MAVGATAVALVAPLAIGPAVSLASTAPGVGQIATFAGGVGSGSPTAIAQEPAGLAVSGSRIYVTDPYLTDVVRFLDVNTGQEGVLAGNGSEGYSGDGGPATSAQLNFCGGCGAPTGVAVDKAGDVFIADEANNVIREVPAASGTQFGIAMTAGDIYTVAGTGAVTGGYTGDGGPATKAELNGPSAVAVDASGDLFIADAGNNVIREVSAATATISTVAGNGTVGYTGDGGPATKAQLDFDLYVIVDGAGDLLISDNFNQVIREVPAASGTQFGVVMTAGDIYTIAGNHGAGYAGDGGPATQAELNYPQGTTLDGRGNLLIADFNNNVIREVSTSGTISTIIGSVANGGKFSGDGGPAAQGGLNNPLAVAVDASGDVFVADSFNDRVREVSAASGTQFGQAMTAGDIYTVAGDGKQGRQPSGDGGPATSAVFNYPYGVAVDSSGDVFVADLGGYDIREVPAASGTQFGQAMTAGDIYTIAGTGTSGYTGDGGPGAKAELGQPDGVAVDGTGNVFVADKFDNVVREVAAVSGTYFGVAMTAGDIYTIAGTGAAGYVGDGGPATSANLRGPTRVAVDAVGDVAVADTANNVVREVAATSGTHLGVAMTAGDIYTVAGNGTAGYVGDGGPATAAELSGPSGVAFDAAGDLAVADWANNRVREVAAQGGTNFGVAMTAGDIYTIAGNGTSGVTTDGSLATATAVGVPEWGGLAMDAAGNLLVPEGGTIEEVSVRGGTNFGIAMAPDDVYTVAGKGPRGLTGVPGPAIQAGITTVDAAVDPAGNLLIADSSDGRVLEVGSGGAGFLRVTTSPAVPSQVAVDGRIADTWALNYLPIAPGNHAVCFDHDIEGYDTPACQTVVVTSGQDTFVTGTFVPRGFLEVGTNPCCMQDAVITVDGVARDDNTVYTDLDAGAHTVCWEPVANETPPPCQGVTLVAGQTLTVIGNYTSTPGSAGPPSTDGFLRVTTSPAVPSQIAVDGVARDTWALNYLRIGAGSHTVCFWRNIEGFDTPACQTVSVTSGQNTFVTGTYVPRGFLEVGTSPSAIGAVISVDGFPADKDVVYTDIPVGTHAVCWAPVAGMTAPACQDVAVTARQTTVVIGTYG